MSRFGVIIVCPKCGRELTDEELNTKVAMQTGRAVCNGCGYLVNLEHDELDDVAARLAK